MNKSFSLIVSFLLTVLFAFFLYYPEEGSKGSTRQEVVIAKVIDGDTIDLVDGRRIRLSDINAPENGRLESNLALDYLKSYENYTLDLNIISIDKYGERYVGEIYSPSEGNKYLNLEMVREGLASKAWVSNSQKELFFLAEKEAIENQRGIWKHSPFFLCVSLIINPKEEFIIFNNSCNNFVFAGSFVKDESREIFIFPNSTTSFISSITLYSNEGVNTNDSFFWGKKNIWNDDRDTAYFFDKEGLLIAYSSYGY